MAARLADHSAEQTVALTVDWRGTLRALMWAVPMALSKEFLSAERLAASTECPLAGH